MLNTQNFLKGVFSIYVLSTLIVPGWIINKIMFVVLMSIFLYDLIRGEGRRLYLAPFVVIILFSYGYLIASFGDYNPDIRRQFLLASLGLLLIHVLLWREIDPMSAFELGAKSIVFGTALFWGVLFYPDIPYSAEIFDWFYDNSFSSVSMRDFIGSELLLTISLGTTSFLFLTYSYRLVKFFEEYKFSNLFWACIYLYVLIVSGRRGVVVIALVFLAIIILLRGGMWGRLAIILCGFAAAGYGYVDIFFEQGSVFSKTEVSNAVKLEHVSSFVSQTDLFQLMFGSGLGANYYSSGSGGVKAHTELTPMDFVRYIGVPFTVILFAVFMIPTVSKINIHKIFSIHGIIMALALVQSVTNPTLISSYGFLSVICYWFYVLNSDKPVSR